MKKTSQQYYVVRSTSDVVNALCDLRDEVETKMIGYSLIIGSITNLQRVKNVDKGN
jgi:hypothetical protein